MKSTITILLFLLTFFTFAQGFQGYSNESNGFTIKAVGGSKVVALYKDSKNKIWIFNDHFTQWDQLKVDFEGGKAFRDEEDKQLIYLYPSSPKTEMRLWYNDSLVARFSFGVRKVLAPEVRLKKNNVSIDPGQDIEGRLEEYELSLMADLSYQYYFPEEHFISGFLIRFRDGNKVLFERTFDSEDRIKIAEKELEKVNNISILPTDVMLINSLGERISLGESLKEYRYFVIKN